MWQLIIGAVTGFLGPIVTQWFHLKEERLKAEERAKDRIHELAVIDKEGEWATKRLTIEGEIRAEEAAQQSFAASYQFGNENLIPDGAKLTPKQMNWVVRVEVFSKAIRPFTTVYYNIVFAVLYSVLAWQIVKTGQVFLSSKESIDIFRECTYSMIGLTETCTLWWYGARKMSKRV